VSLTLRLGLVFASAAALLVIMATVKVLGARYAWSAELQRKSVHMATGAYALVLPFLFTEFWPVGLLIALVGTIMLVLRLPRFAHSPLGATLHGVERKSYGELLLAVSVGFIFYFSLGKPVLYILPIAVLTLSDAAAALIGTRYGRRHFAVEAGTKSIEGVAMFFMVTWIVAMVTLLIMTDVGRINVVLLSFVIAAFGALVEADSWRGFDNLFVPVGLHLFLANHLQTNPIGLLLIAALFLAILMAVLTLAPLIGVSQHAARAYTVLFFLICAVTAPYNALLPLAAVLAHVAARQSRPCKSTYPDLDFLVVATGAALFWLFIGEYTARNAIDVYNLTFAGTAVGYVALAAGQRFVLSVAAAAALFMAALGIAWLDGDRGQWHGSLAPWVAVSLVLCLLVPILWPIVFDRYRGPRMLGVALLVPLCLFAW
jgi:phytol kinase